MTLLKKEEKEVVIVDELSEFLAEDPTFGGLREDAPRVIAYRKVREVLREIYLTRFRGQPPADTKDLFLEIADEVTLPYEEGVREFVIAMYEKRVLSQKDEKRILKLVDKFLKSAKHL